MKITFLGTGAADWHLQRPEEATEYRRRSSVLIDDVLLIDPGPQVPEALKETNKCPEKIKYIINTHSHSDHFSKETLTYLEALGATFISMAEGDVRTVDRYTIRACRANHGTCEKAVHFLISDPFRTVFYGLDGAWLLYDEVQAIKEHRPDFAVLDGTIGDKDGDYRIFEHNNLHMVLEMQKTLRPYVKKFCISHMAETLHKKHADLCDDLSAYDILVAYDGLELKI